MTVPDSDKYTYHINIQFDGFTALLYISLFVRYVCLLTGTLIHYNSPGLSDLYFVDPPWLYDLLSSVVPMDYSNSGIWDQGIHIVYNYVCANAYH